MIDGEPSAVEQFEPAGIEAELPQYGRVDVGDKESLDRGKGRRRRREGTFSSHGKAVTSTPVIATRKLSPQSFLAGSGMTSC
jgi:hypothetical protein